MKAAAVLVIVLGVTGAAVAQDLTLSPLPLLPGAPMPQTEIIKNQNGEVVGTATGYGNQVVFRNAKGELTGSARIENGVATYYDPHGKVVRTATIKDGKLITQDVK